jgi:hypothetical protein
MKKLAVLLCLAMAVVLLGGSALAQGDNSVYFTTYFANTRNPYAMDTTVRLVNDGDTGNTLWASFYVFDDSQELSECCACPITPDGLLSESVNYELLANPLTGRYLHTGVIKVISSSNPNSPVSNTPAPGLRGTAVHAQHGWGNNYQMTEVPLADSNLIGAEQTMLQNLCSYAIQLGSGTGVCSCTPEDHDF